MGKRSRGVQPRCGNKYNQNGHLLAASITLPFAFKKTVNSRDRFSVFVLSCDYFVPALYLNYPITKSTVTSIECGAANITEKGTTTINYLVRGYWK